MFKDSVMKSRKMFVFLFVCFLNKDLFISLAQKTE